MHKDFRLVILATWQSEDHLKKILASIPHSDQMQLLTIKQGQALDYSVNSIQALAEKKYEFQGAVKEEFNSSEAREDKMLQYYDKWNDEKYRDAKYKGMQ